MDSSGRLKHDLEHYSFSRSARPDQRASTTTRRSSARQMYERAGAPDRWRSSLHPPAALLRNYILRRGFLDGTAGLTISLMNAWSVGIEVHEAVGASEKSQIPNPKSQIPMSPFGLGLEFWDLGFWIYCSRTRILDGHPGGHLDARRGRRIARCPALLRPPCTPMTSTCLTDAARRAPSRDRP